MVLDKKIPQIPIFLWKLKFYHWQQILVFTLNYQDDVVWDKHVRWLQVKTMFHGTTSQWPYHHCFYISLALHHSGTYIVYMCLLFPGTFKRCIFRGWDLTTCTTLSKTFLRETFFGEIPAVKKTMTNMRTTVSLELLHCLNWCHFTTFAFLTETSTDI